MKYRLTIFILTAGLLLAGAAVTGKWPWQRRIGKNVHIHHKLQHQRVTADMWPKEPESPSNPSPEKFQEAFSALCGAMPLNRLSNYATAILEEAAQFQVDPFLIGALIFDRSGCRPKTPDNSATYGLSRIDVAMHAPHIRRKQYNFFILEENQWVLTSLPAPKFPFNKWKAAKWDSNIYWTAAILSVYKQQQASLSQSFSQTPYRHFVSHWFFGDNVRNIEPEDRILTARRRLLAYYHSVGPVPAGTFNSVPLVSPLDGVPRLVLDDFGNKRGDKWGPGHQGVDLVAVTGEPIRAMADGRVVFAGTDLPGAGSNILTPDEAAQFNSAQMGKGGLYVAINHGDGFRTYYMHMNSIAVTHRQEVKAGEIIGTVGRSGAAHSGPHLHLEFRYGTERKDPAQYMKSVLVDPSNLNALK